MHHFEQKNNPVPADRYHPDIVPPLKFTDPDDLNRRISEYIDSCYIPEIIAYTDPVTKEPKEKIARQWINSPSIVGLANHLACDISILYEYMNEKHRYHPGILPEISKKLADALIRAKGLIHEYTVWAALNHKSSQGPIFVLKNNFGWRDEQIVKTERDAPDQGLDLSKLSVDERSKMMRLSLKSDTSGGMLITMESEK
jgi:hypothetical protein